MSTDKPDGGDDSFAALFAQSTSTLRRKPPRVGELIEAIVVQVGRDSVFVELDGKRQAFIEAQELRAEDGTMTVAVGQKIRARVIEVDEGGNVRLGQSMGKPGSVAALEQAKESGVAVEGKVVKLNKGGLEVELAGTRAFCPNSQVDSKYVEDPSTFVGRSLQFLVTEIRDGGRSVTVSRRALLERESREAAATAMKDIVPGAVLRGTVTGVREFGAFVDLGGVEGMIPASEIAHERGVVVANAVSVGDVVEVQVRDVKQVEPKRAGDSTTRITLSIKALKPAPERAPQAAGAAPSSRVAIGSIVTGAVDKIETYGVFVQIDGTKGRAGRGLIPSAELGVPRGTDVRKTFPEGTKITAKVLETGDGRMRLSIRGAREDAERAEYDGYRETSAAPATLGTFGDLLKKRGEKRR